MRVIMALALALSGCGMSHAIDDGGVASDGGAIAERDAARDVDAGLVDAAHAGDAGVVETIDAGPDESAGWIACGATRCEAATMGCLASCQRDGVYEPACIAYQDDGTWPREECPSGEEQFPRYWLQCDGAEDCPSGERCGLIFGSLGNYAYCGPTFQTELCHADADCPLDAPHCRVSSDLPGYSTCAAE